MNAIKLSRKTKAAVKAVTEAEWKRHLLQTRSAKIGDQLIGLTLVAAHAAATDAMKAGIKMGTKVWFFVEGGRMSGYAQDIVVAKREDEAEPVVMVKTLDTMPLVSVPLTSAYLKRPSMKIWTLK